MKFAKWIFAALLALSAFPALSCPKSDCVRIGSWNIAWLGSEKREQFSDAATIDTMAQLIADDWSIDLVTLEEINTSLDGDVRGEHYSTQQWGRLRTALEKKGYRTQAGSSGNAQHIVLAWRKPVEVLQLPRDMNIPDSYLVDKYCRSSNLRKPLAGFFRAGKFDFWVVGLHLKSGYGGNAACANAVRSMQVRDITRQLGDLERTDKDILLVGDFNASGSHDSLHYFREKGFLALTDKDSRNKESSGRSHGSGKRGKIIDHLMINPVNTSEWQDKSTVLYSPADYVQFRKHYSDHFPVWSDFRTSRDDD